MKKVYELEVEYLKYPIPDYAKLTKSLVETSCPKFTSDVELAIRTARNIVEDIQYGQRNRTMSLADRTTEIYGCDTDGYFFKVLSSNLARKVIKIKYKRHIK